MFAPEQKMRSFVLVKTIAFDLGVLEADAVQGVGELDVDAEVVRVELERVTGTEPAVLLHVHREPRDRAAVGHGEVELPVLVAIRMRLEANRLGRTRDRRVRP